MGEIETSKHQITLYYNSNSEKDRKALATALSQGYAIEEVDLQKTKLTGVQLVELADRLGKEVKDLVNQEHPSYKANFSHHDYSTDDWIKMIQNNPEILAQPIALRGDKTSFIQTSSDLMQM